MIPGIEQDIVCIGGRSGIEWVGFVILGVGGEWALF